jgi:hypothetical protein
MGIDQIQLTSELLKSLYPETLVGTMEPFWGGNGRFISFLCYYPDQDFLPEEQFIFLHKMLSACKLSMDDIVLINTGRLSFTFDELRKQCQPVIIFLWGIRPDSLGLNTDLPDFTISTIDGISVVQIPSPDVMIGTDNSGHDLKQQLWACLKKLFNL